MTATTQGRFGFFRRFWRDTSGLNAIEFAFCAPVLLTMYFGTVEISDRLMADRKSTTLASTAADLVAQDTEVTDAEMTEILNATAAVLLPMDPTNATIRISQIVADDDGATTVDWSDGLNIAALSPGAAVEVPDGLVPDGGAVILAETSYTHTSTTAIVIQESRTVTDRFWLRPRRSDSVSRID
jgi:Flp pilus assembly protein TadG